MSRIQIIKTGITSLKTDALVNAANEGLRAGGGVCGIIFQAAGRAELQEACQQIGRCKTGCAVITPGFNLKSKYIIHAVGPRWVDGGHDEPKLLHSAYMQSLQLAMEHDCKSIGFPLISAGIFGYPADKAWQVAIQACIDFQEDHPENCPDIQFAVIDDSILDIGKKTLTELKKERTTQFLTRLDDEGLKAFRRKLSKESDLIMDKKANAMAGGLMNVICNPEVMEHLSADQIRKVADSIFPDWLTEESWLAQYADILLRVIDEVKRTKAKPDTRAEKYEKHMRDILIPALKEGFRAGDVYDDLDTLVDIYKVAVCLFRYYSDRKADFVFVADRDSMDQINNSIQNGKGTGNQLLGIIYIPLRIEERQYATFLSWVLEELLCKQE